jgi:hypothetical protein
MIAVMSLMIGDGVAALYDASHARIGVGDSSTAFAVNQTDLQAATNKLRKIVDGAPVRTSNSVDFTSTFQLAEGNFAWNEIGLFNSASGDYMATRRILTGFGTKTSTEVWTITLTVVGTAA